MSKGKENQRYLNAFNNGVKAAKNNYHRRANPYPRRSILFSRWLAGFNSTDIGKRFI